MMVTREEVRGVVVDLAMDHGLTVIVDALVEVAMRTETKIPPAHRPANHAAVAHLRAAVQLWTTGHEPGDR